MSEMIDLTDALIDWKETCAILKCSPENRNNLAKVAQGVIKLKLNNLPRRIVSTWQSYLQNHSNFSVFNELEAYLYKMDKIKGRPIKEYLFDDIGKRAGGLGNNVSGYLMTTLEHLFQKTLVKDLAEQKPDDSNNPNAQEDQARKPEELIDEDDSTIQGNDEASIFEPVKKLVIKIISEEWDDDIRLGVFCKMKNIKITNSHIRPFFIRKKSALAEAIQNAAKKMKDDLAELDIDHRKDYLMILRTIVIPWLEDYFAKREDLHTSISNYDKQKNIFQ